MYFAHLWLLLQKAIWLCWEPFSPLSPSLELAGIKCCINWEAHVLIYCSHACFQMFLFLKEPLWKGFLWSLNCCWTWNGMRVWHDGCPLGSSCHIVSFKCFREEGTLLDINTFQRIFFIAHRHGIAFDISKSNKICAIIFINVSYLA